MKKYYTIYSFVCLVAFITSSPLRSQTASQHNFIQTNFRSSVFPNDKASKYISTKLSIEAITVLTIDAVTKMVSADTLCDTEMSIKNYVISIVNVEC